MAESDALARMLSLVDSATKHRMLMAAAQHGDVELLQRVLSSSAPSIVLAVDAYRCNACMQAAGAGHARCCQVLLETYAAEQQVLHQLPDGPTAAMLAVLGQNMGSFQQLLRFVPQQQLEMRDHDGETPLLMAVRQGSVGFVLEILAAALKPERLLLQRSADRESALTLAASLGFDQVLQLLLPHATGAQHLSAALGAVGANPLSEGHKRCCRLLFARGASVTGVRDEQQRRRIEALFQEAVATQLVPDAVTQAVNDAVVQLASVVTDPSLHAAKRARTGQS